MRDLRGDITMVIPSVTHAGSCGKSSDHYHEKDCWCAVRIVKQKLTTEVQEHQTKETKEGLKNNVQ